MSLFHAVVWTDHQSAQVLQFGAEHVLANKVEAHTHHTAQHGSAVRSEHEFFGELRDALGGVSAVLVTGSREVVDRPSENQLVALARKYFLEHAPMVMTRKPA